MSVDFQTNRLARVFFAPLWRAIVTSFVVGLVAADRQDQRRALNPTAGRPPPVTRSSTVVVAFSNPSFRPAPSIDCLRSGSAGPARPASFRFSARAACGTAVAGALE